uniref:Cilia- and flagella-associated protein 263 n=1 Tax=Sphenodon punctatus TaxID=8508 RepID=A0A8D0GH23_SPHPU
HSGFPCSHANSTLKVETEMFEKYFNKMESRDLVLLPPYLLLSPVLQPRGRRKSKSRVIADRLIGLMVEQKCDIAQRELDDRKEEVQKMKENSEWTMQNCEAVIEEADIRWTEIKKAMSDFDKDIIKTITKKKGSVIASEKVLRYMEEKNRHRKPAMSVFISLYFAGLQKEEMGEALHEVDFQQLKIENAQFLEKIDERNQDLLQLKLTAGNTLQILNSYKVRRSRSLAHAFCTSSLRKLQNATGMSTHLVKDISQRKESLGKIEREAILVEEERDTAETLNKKLRKQLSDYKVPPVLQYVHEKMDIHDLENNIKTWERKVEIAEVQ